jgi:hypothetical protein
MTDEERFWAKVDKTDSCWLWTAGASEGYGRFRVSRPTRRTLAAHRVAYEWLVGPIPDGLQLDHLCRNPSCVNPDHLEPVTNRENGRRGIKGELTTHCPQGHPYSGVNLYVHPRGRRKCRQCRKEQMRILRERRRWL